jgi:sulfide:quinone oxidoreductase
VAGSERLHDALPEFESGTILIGIVDHPFKSPPAPFEGAISPHDYLVQRGIRDAAEIRVIVPDGGTGSDHEALSQPRRARLRR